MSIDINWDNITSGPDGEALAEKVRSFVHYKFQQIELPRFIRSVQVHSFDFGKTCPDLEIKDICDPLPDFYEDDEDDDDEGNGRELKTNPSSTVDPSNEENLHKLQEQLKNESQKSEKSTGRPSIISTAPDPRLQGFGSPFGFPGQLNSPFRTGTPGIPGGTSNLSYFHLPLGQISGTQTPLAAVAGGSPYQANWQENLNGHSQLQHHHHHHHHHHNALPDSNHPSLPKAEAQGAHSPVSRPSTGVTVPMSPESLVPTESIASHSGYDIDNANDLPSLDSPPLQRMTEKRTEDIQVVCRLKYSGDIRMTLAAEILLDYPMPSFVGIPLTLSITGLTFDGVAVIAYIRKRAHFCFLSPEDAHALVGADEEHAAEAYGPSAASRRGSVVSDKQMDKSLGGLLQEIRVESEIGKRENGKQALKNVSKVEKFVLEQVRRIFEDEFVFPSYWTFLV